MGAYKYYVCAIAKNEHIYLEEWIRHHLNIGFDKIFIFEDYESNSHMPITEKFGDAVELMKCEDVFGPQKEYDSGGKRQRRAYNKFIFTHKDDNAWCAFLDIDEFFMMEDGETLDSLTEFLDNREMINMCVYWKLFGANGHIERPSGSTIDVYPTPTTIMDIPSSSEYRYRRFLFTTFKSFVKLCGTKQLFSENVHEIDNLHDLNGNIVGLHGMMRTPIYKKAWVNHYFSKSWEDWCVRMRRGNMTRGIRKIEEFFQLNYDLVDKKEELIKKFYEDYPIQEKRACIFTFVKNEHLYIKEWIDYHLNMGFKKIFIMEDIGSESHKDLLKEYGDKVELFTYDIMITSVDNYISRQMQAFDWFFTREYLRGNFDWCLFTDDDEFLEFENKEMTLNEFLCEYNNFKAIALYWKNYNANGRIKREEGSVFDLYKSEKSFFVSQQNKIIKSFVNLNNGMIANCKNKFKNVHEFYGEVKTNKMPYDTDKKTICYSKAWLDHFRTKSWEDWAIKIKRGFCLPKTLLVSTKTIDKFFEWNPDLANKKDELMKMIDEC